MAIGLSTYAFFWRFSETAERPLTLIDMVEKTHQLGLSIFQICDYAPIQAMSDAELAELRDVAESSGIKLELGTRGIQKSHLMNYLDIASKLGSTFLRTMLHTPDHKPSVPEAIAFLNEDYPYALIVARPSVLRPMNRCRPRTLSASWKESAAPSWAYVWTPRTALLGSNCPLMSLIGLHLS
jgi:hypothetical protein